MFQLTKFGNLLKIITLAFFLIPVLPSSVSGQNFRQGEAGLWVDSVLNSLSTDQRIAQLLMIRAYSNRDAQYLTDLAALVREVNPGGVCFFQGGPVRQAQAINVLQENAQTPLLVALDAEWGPGMRLDSINWFPKQMTLGAIQNDSLIYQMGAGIAAQLKRLGVHVSFSPVADVNNNPANPVINARSFGEDRFRVAHKSAFYMKGLQDHGIFAVAKHFPGHGDTGSDSHYTLPVINKSRQQLDSTELFPFRVLIGQGVKGIMISHLAVPAIDSSAKAIATLSQPMIKNLLNGELGFTGMVITDGMDMKGLTDFSDPRMVEADALIAGNDILLLPVDARKAVSNIRAAIDSGYLSMDLVNQKVRKVLLWKSEAGLNRLRPIETKDLVRELNSVSAAVITAKANAEAITLVADPAAAIPFRISPDTRFASLVIGDTLLSPFQEMLSAYAQVDHFNLPKEPDKALADSIALLLSKYNTIIVGFVKTSDMPQKNFGISPVAAAFVDSLATVNNLVLNIFTSPYSLATFKNTDRMAAVVVSYQDNANMQQLTAQALFGGLPVKGRLPVSATSAFRCGTGLDRMEKIRVSYSLPEMAGISTRKIAEVDSVMQQAIDEGAFPGGQIVVIRKGMVVLQKSYGNKTYDQTEPVTNQDLYDLASLTKMLSTTLAVMKLTAEDRLNPDEKLAFYLPGLRKSNKSQLSIREIMAHQAGLQPYIPFYRKLMKGSLQDSSLIARHFSVNYPVRVADAMYIGDQWHKFISDSIAASPLLKKREYKYSDLGFILLADAVSEVTGEPLSSYVKHNFYDRLGLLTLDYFPRNRFSVSRIAPTELDTVFRKQLIRGDVHDPAAAMLGGMSGHAGLFGNAMDVAVLMQMLLNEGNYGGEVFLDPETVKEFTRTQYPENKNRRGLGFDKPAPDGQPGPTCSLASPHSFGHTGFTGTYAWADPDADLVYVFLSNRVYPDAGNNKITRMDIRTRIHEIIYRSVTE